MRKSPDGWSLKRIQPYLFISPFFLLYAVFGVYPLLNGLGTAATIKDSFAGLENFRQVFQDKMFWTAIQNALIYMLGSIFIILPVALGAALLLSSRRIGRMRALTSTIYFFPNVTSVLVVGIVFKLLLKTNHGTFNEMLLGLHLIDKPLKFLADPNLAIPSLLLVCTWRYFGINALYFLSGLQGVPEELCEAARIDGCNALKEFWHVKLPLLKPIGTFIIFTAITGSFALSGEVYTLVGVGGTGARNSMLFPVVYLYNSMFRDNRMNQAAAMGYMLAVILLIITSLQRWLFREKN